MSLPPDFSTLSPQDQSKIQNATQFKQLNNMVFTLEQVLSTCFATCCTEMTSALIQDTERNCLKKCHTKFFDSLNRSTIRLGEEQLKLKIKLER
jgi:hypothetical protein